jgi:thioredoxin-related protein
MRLSHPLIAAAFAIAVLGALPALAQGTKGEAPPPPAPPAAPAPALLPWLENYEEAAKLAKEKNQLILTDLFSDKCGWCKKLEQDTFPAPEVQEVLKNFVLLKLNTGKAEFAKELLKKAGTTAVPATVITDADWNLVRFISGYMDSGPYAEKVRKGLTAHQEFTALLPKVKDGTADYETTYNFLKACDELSRKAEIQAHGEKALAAVKGEHHADIAFFLSKTYEPGTPEFVKYKDLTLQLDPDNRFGHLDDFIMGDAIRIVYASKSKEETSANLDKAIVILEARLGQAAPAVNKEKGQAMYFMLYKLCNGKKDQAKAKEMLKKGVEFGPDTTLGKHMAKILGQLGG